MHILPVAVLLIALISTIEAGYRNNCHGSFRCSKGMGPTCQLAYGRFTDYHTYHGYTSRTFGHCTAIYRCSGDYPRLTGEQLKEQFRQIYLGQGCRGCGSHAFNDGRCEVTVNYCDKCLDSGDPN